jgi:hypothetical protein
MHVGNKYGRGRINVLVPPLLLFILAVAGPFPSNPAFARQPVAPQNSANRILATISQSGSTNSLGFKVVIRDDGSAAAEIAGTGAAPHPEPSRSQQFPAGTIDAATLQRLLTEVGDVGKIPTGTCPKSVSFGTRTQITYAGKTSGDLQCIRQPQGGGGDRAPLQASEELGRFVQATLAQLKINTRRVYSIQQP